MSVPDFLLPVKQTFGVTFPMLMIFVTGIIVFTLSRLALCLWKKERVSNAKGWKPIFVSGLRMDVVSACYVIILPCLLAPLFIGVPYVGPAIELFLRVWFTIGLWLIVYMEVATPMFIEEYNVRPNRFFVEYLIYPKEVFSMLWTGYKLALALAAVISVATLYFGWQYTGYLLEGLHSPAWYWRPVLALGTVALCVLGARSSLGHRGVNPSSVAFSTDNLMNDLVLNSTYSLLYAIKLMRRVIDAANFYPEMSDAAVVKSMQNNSQLPTHKFKHPELPTLAYREASSTGKPKNIVILLQESLGARFVGGLGGMPLTPNLDKLMKESWNFTRMYATGTRSIRGIEAVTTSFLPTPANAVVKLPKSQNNFYSLAQTLKTEGYQTQFVYGGESHFDNMKSFMLGNGFVNIQDITKFDNPEFVGSWGVCDEDLYNKAHEQFSQFAEESDKPFFSLVFTTTNHSPFEYPKDKIDLYNKPAGTCENAVKYSDYALGKFLEKAKNSSYWADTIFVVVADHDARVEGDQIVPIDNFHIPAVIFGGGVGPYEDSRLASQIDLPPTLLSLAGVSAHHPMTGHDFTKEVDSNKRRAVMQYHQSFLWLNEDHHAVVFQPEREAMTFKYESKGHTLSEYNVPAAEVETANAMALWASLCYKQDFYQWDKIEAAIRA